MKIKHMLVRLFFMDFKNGDDPILVLTTPMKISSIAVVLHVQAVITALYFIIVLGDDPSLHTTTTSLVAGLLAAALARPLLEVCDSWFKFCMVGYASRLRQGRAHNDLLHAGAALHWSLHMVDVQNGMQKWKDAVDDMRRQQFRSVRSKFFGPHLVLQHSAVHESFSSVVSAGGAISRWRDATVDMLRSVTSTALKRAHVGAQQNTYVRIVRLELLAAPETLRRADESTLSQCSATFDRIQKLARASR